MIPDDDMLWPLCKGPDCDAKMPRHWCRWIRDWLLENKDSANVFQGIRICVPVYPDLGVYTEVSIEADSVAPGMAVMAIVKQIPFVNDEEFIDIGIWCKGEGRASISCVIQDWLKGQASNQKCKNSSHDFNAEQKLMDISLDRDKWSQHLWHMAIDEMCLPCYERFQIVSQSASANFGVNLSITGGNPPSGRSNNSSIIQTLKSRYA